MTDATMPLGLRDESIFAIAHEATLRRAAA